MPSTAVVECPGAGYGIADSSASAYGGDLHAAAGAYRCDVLR